VYLLSADSLIHGFLTLFVLRIKAFFVCGWWFYLNLPASKTPLIFNFFSFQMFDVRGLAIINKKRDLRVAKFGYRSDREESREV